MKSKKAQPIKPFAWQQLKVQPIIGVDEVGRGCLAGPVYAAAVIINPDKDFSAFSDSKTLSEKRREQLAELIFADHQVGLGFATVEEIGRLNILQASLLAMKRAVARLSVDSGHILVDGNQKIPGVDRFVQTTLIKGDLRAAPVAAASIVAKVTRDRQLVKMAEKYPVYGFEQHKGYATAIHAEAIAKWGPCPEHRTTFAGVKEYVDKQGALV